MEGDGTTVAVCRKSSDATNVRWEPCAPDQGPDRDSPLGYLIASGIFVASYRAVPVASYLGGGTAVLKAGFRALQRNDAIGRINLHHEVPEQLRADIPARGGAGEGCRPGIERELADLGLPDRKAIKL